MDWMIAVRIAGLVAEMVLGVLLIGAVVLCIGFQSEYMRYNNNVTDLFSTMILLVMVTPLALAGVNIWRTVISHQSPLIGFGFFLVLFVLAGVLSFGLLRLNEKLGPGAQRAAVERQIADLKAQTAKGDGASACRLTIMDAASAEQAFPVCHAHIAGLTDIETRWRQLQVFTEGAAFVLRKTGIRPDGYPQFKAIVPPQEQAWFLETFFRTMMDVPPSAEKLAFKPLPDEDFNDLLNAGNLLRSLGEPDAWDPAALAVFRAEILPAFKKSMEPRLAEARAAAAAVPPGTDLLTVSRPAGLSRTAEMAYQWLQWWQKNLDRLER